MRGLILVSVIVVLVVFPLPGMAGMEAMSDHELAGVGGDGGISMIISDFMLTAGAGNTITIRDANLATPGPGDIWRLENLVITDPIGVGTDALHKKERPFLQMSRDVFRPIPCQPCN